MEKLPFSEFVTALQQQFSVLTALGQLYVVDVDKTTIYDTYLDSFPEGTNELYKTNREHDCNCCKAFIRKLGRVVAIRDNQLVSIWDVTVGGQYQPVADALSALVRGSKITGVFLHDEPAVGVQKSTVLQPDQTTRVWNHFYQVLPKQHVCRKDSLPAKRGRVNENRAMLKRAVSELQLSAVETVIDLIEQDSLYRGDEHLGAMRRLEGLLKEWSRVPEDERELWLWQKATELGDRVRVRNSSIGELVSAISEGKELDAAVGAYERMVAPTNYKRSKALVTPAMIKQAQDTVVQLGLESSLSRRYAVESDLTINNVLFADRSSKIQGNVFDTLLNEAQVNRQQFDRVEEISINDFLTNVVPKVDSIELLMENRLAPNLVSLIAPVQTGMPRLFQWPNDFSWSYNGEVTDSIKERVKTHGGNVDGPLRVSLSWHSGDDLDLHMYGPGGTHVYFARSSRRANGAYLDLDMNGLDKHDSVNPVENIIWENERDIAPGVYRIDVHCYSRHANENGFAVELDYKGQTTTFEHPETLLQSRAVTVVRFSYSAAEGVKIIESIPSSMQSKTVWGLKTQTFQKVRLLLNSPNHWDDNACGNKHVLFILDGCVNPEGTRGFYNEYLRTELYPAHRKVFETLGSKLRVAPSDDQLSGLGFSSTQRNEAIVRVSGSFTRTLKIKF